MVRGFIPDGLRSSPKTGVHGETDTPRLPDLRVLRTRSGMNPLATKALFQKRGCVMPSGCICGTGLLRSVSRLSPVPSE
ncbi:hypothetical protein EMIT0P260_60110 [Pseudomonas sp. IT-P260]